MRIDPPSISNILTERDNTINDLNVSYRAKIEFLQTQIQRANSALNQITAGYQLQISIYEKYQASTIVEQAALGSLRVIQKTIETTSSINLLYQQWSAELSLENDSTESAALHTHTIRAQAVSQVISTISSLIDETGEIVKALADIAITESIIRKWDSTVGFTAENILLLATSLAAQTSEINRFVEYNKQAISEATSSWRVARRQVTKEFDHLIEYRKTVDRLQQEGVLD